jgi:hypothetical protein
MFQSDHSRSDTGGRRPLRRLLLALAAVGLIASLQLTASAAGTPVSSIHQPAFGTPPPEATISASANPNLTPFLFSQDPNESAAIYAGSQEYAATHTGSCGGAVPAEQGGCCPFAASDGACDDHDPAATGCADATSITVTDANITDSSGNIIGYVEVRYSSTCKTNWGRVTGLGAYAAAIKQTTTCRGAAGQYADSGCTDTDTGVEATRFSDQLYAPSECVSVVGTLIQPAAQGGGQFSATTSPAC